MEGENAQTEPSTPRLRSLRDLKERDTGKANRIDSLVPDRDDIFFAAVETTRMPMIVTDPRRPDNPIVFANHAFLAMTGYDAIEIIGSNCRFLQGPETDQGSISELRRAIAERREHATEILNYRKDGYSFWNALYVSPVFDQTGELVYFFGSQLDVTRRREAEDALRQAQKTEALGRLTGGIAHDFNNLLQVIIGHLDLMSSHLKKPDIDRARLTRGVDNARAAAERASNLTQQLLSFARKQRLEGRTLNLNRLVLSLRELADRTLGDDVVIDVELDDTLRNCRIDPTQAEVAILNILINARDAMAGRPEKRLRIVTRNVEVVPGETKGPSNLPPGRYVSVAISDSGSGIPSNVVERVMDPFFTTKEEGKGTGLGLSMVYGFARQSGGTAALESNEGIGTTVHVYFPAVDEAPSDEPTPRGRAMDRPGSETILLVEDRQDVADLARMILEDLNYKVLHAPNGRLALEMLDANDDVALLFSDLIMPGDIDGVALAREAKSRRSDLKVLLTTGYAEASLERTEAGGPEFDVLNKPYGRADLARKVRVILDGPTGVT